jgi:hypothetical protein
MNREEFIEDLPALIDLYKDSCYREYKEGSTEDPGNTYNRLIAIGWVKLTDEGGPWKRVTVTPEGEALIDRLIHAAGFTS